MKIAGYLPHLTLAEAERCWLSPADTTSLAGMGDLNDELRRFLGNVSHLLPHVKSGTGKTSPKLYSCLSSMQLRVLREVSATGRPYEFAAPISEAVAQIARDLITTIGNLDDLDRPNGFQWYVVYECIAKDKPPKPVIIGPGQFTPQHIIQGYETGIVAAGEIIWNALRHYADYWARERIATGKDRPPGVYEGFDDTGSPLDISHLTYRDMTPLERAKRLVEIEEFVSKRDGCSEKK